MSMRKTNVFSFNVSAGIFKNFNDAVKEANAIKIWLNRLCKKKGYSCKAIIGISMHNPQTGYVKPHKSGGRGRPKVIFKRSTKMMKPCETEPHLHIILYANPGNMIRNLLAKHLNNKYKKEVAWVKNCSGYISVAVDYVFKQCIKLRKVEIDETGILINDDMGFYKAVEDIDGKYGQAKLSFTYFQPPKSPTNANREALHEDSKDEETLQCNSFIDKDINLNMYNLYTYLIKTNKNRTNIIYIPMFIVCIYLIRRFIPP